VAKPGILEAPPRDRAPITVAAASKKGERRCEASASSVKKGDELCTRDSHGLFLGATRRIEVAEKKQIAEWLKSEGDLGGGKP